MCVCLFLIFKDAKYHFFRLASQKRINLKIIVILLVSFSIYDTEPWIYLIHLFYKRILRSCTDQVDGGARL